MIAGLNKPVVKTEKGKHSKHHKKSNTHEAKPKEEVVKAAEKP
jgi:hypothetical protein